MEPLPQKKVFGIYPSPVCKTYGVVIKFSEHNEVHFEAEVSWLKEPSTGSFQFLINKQQVYCNGKAPDKTVDKLADDMGKILYPLVVMTNEKGIITGIGNSQEIALRWQEQKEKIRQRYEGEIVDQAIDAMDRITRNSNQLIETIKKDWFLALLFSGIYGLKPKDSTELNAFMVPVIPYGPLTAYQVSRIVTERNTAIHCLTVVCSGEPATIKGKIKPEGSLAVTYKLYHQDFTIRSVNGQSTLILPGGKQAVTIFEVFHLSAKDRPVLTAQDKEPAAAQKKKSFWNIFN